MTRPDLRIRACTWNVNHDSDARDVAPVFADTIKRGVDVWLLQEVKAHSGIVEMLRDRGLGVRHTNPEFAIAWNRDRFECLWDRRILMSPTRYWTLNYALVVMLRDNETAGRRVKGISYHPPAHVQAPRHPTFPKVSKVLREWDSRLEQMARRSRAAVLAGGDDNVDESKGWHPQGGWGFMLDGPLEQIRAPQPTHGGRRIDDFRVRGLRPAGSGLVLPVHTKDQDHRPFIHDFAYA